MIFVCDLQIFVQIFVANQNKCVLFELAIYEKSEIDLQFKTKRKWQVPKRKRKSIEIRIASSRSERRWMGGGSRGLWMAGEGGNSELQTRALNQRFEPERRWRI
ncbi:hypothetical protein U1Q18_011697 [Sarracenia purpurea var. burkii]